MTAVNVAKILKQGSPPREKAASPGSQKRTASDYKVHEALQHFQEIKNNFKLIHKGVFAFGATEQTEILWLKHVKTIHSDISR